MSAKILRDMEKRGIGEMMGSTDLTFCHDHNMIKTKRKKLFITDDVYKKIITVNARHLGSSNGY